MSKRVFGFFTSSLVSVGAEPPVSGWQPNTDIYRTPWGWLVKFDLAGVRPEEVELTLRGNRLSVRGVRRDSCLEECSQCYQMEISYSQFERIVILPMDATRARIEAEHRHGMLLVRIHLEDQRS
jgi:HSP20 family protein